MKYFTVAELIKTLKKIDPKRIVIMSTDSEGNSYRPLATMTKDNCTYEPNVHGWEGDIGLEKLTTDLKKVGFTEEDVIKGKKAVVFYPVN